MKSFSQLIQEKRINPVPKIIERVVRAQST